jgi:hypothetical protein
MMVATGNPKVKERNALGKLSIRICGNSLCRSEVGKEQIMRMKLKIFITCLAVITALFCFSSAIQAQKSCPPERIVKVMTRNLDAGSDFGFVIQAASDPDTTQLQLLLAISNTFQERSTATFRSVRRELLRKSSAIGLTLSACRK